MSILPLCFEPDPALRTVAQPIKRITPAIRRLARDMIQTMVDHDGIGLAAPQVGKDLQLFIANPSQEEGKELVVINPVLQSIRGRVSIVEGCFSSPNIWERVRRHEVVRLQGKDLFGRPIDFEVGGLLAIVLQHEVDHLQGHLFIDRLSWLRRSRALARWRKLNRNSGSARR